MTQTATEARASDLDAALADLPLDGSTPAELFAVVDALDAQSSLKRVLTDPATEADVREQLAVRLLEGKVGPQALMAVRHAVVMRWNSGSGLADALERQAVRGFFRQAAQGGYLDEVTGQLHDFLELVRGNADLRAALSGTSRPLEARQQLVRQLLQGKAHGWVVDLAVRATAGRERNLELTLEKYLSLAAGLRNRIVAQVTVARPLDADQEARLRAALSRLNGREVDIQTTVDESVIGGVRVRLGDDIIEGTVADRLEQLQRQLS